MFHNTKTNTNNIQILFEDNHLLIVNKRSGDIVQGDKTGDSPLSDIIKAFIKKRDSKPGEVYLGVPHRLDRPTSGIVVFAKTSKALTRLNKIFAEKKSQKTYWAVVKNKPPVPSQELVHWMTRNTKQNKSTAHSKEVTNSKKAELSYLVKQEFDRYYLLEIDLKTGRHHQIRAQLAAIGCPIKGDLKYGFDRSNKDGSIHLHARMLRFIHPVKKEEISVIAPPPMGDPIWDLCINDS